MSTFAFHCTCCGETHEGIPTFGAKFPVQLMSVPGEERAVRVERDDDRCVIDGKFFFVRGCIEIPVHGYPDDPFIWGAWVSLSEENFATFQLHYHEPERSHLGPFFGWLSSDFLPYETACLNLKTYLHLRDNGTRPYIELEPTDHPLAVEQREGITSDRVAEIYKTMMHPDDTGGY